MNKDPIAQVGLFLVLVGILLAGSVFVQHEIMTVIVCFFASILANLAGCACGIIGWNNRLGKAAVVMALLLAVFYVYVIVLLALYPPHFGYRP